MKRADILALDPCAYYQNSRGVATPLLRFICPDPDKDYTLGVIVARATLGWEVIHQTVFPEIHFNYIVSTVVPPPPPLVGTSDLHLLYVYKTGAEKLFQKYRSRRKIIAHPIASYHVPAHEDISMARRVRLANPQVESWRKQK